MDGGRPENSLHGLLNLDKPAGMTSRDVVSAVQRLLPRKTKVGHAGTLDPLASGVLVVCIGAATRLTDRVQEHRKGYLAGLQFGVRSDTDDSTGKITTGGDPTGLSANAITNVLGEFLGEIAQVPPKFSAVHVAGQRAYALARKAQSFELTARTVQVDSLNLLRFSGVTAELTMQCGSGTYVRSIIRDLGERLGCGAIMTSLRRTFIGPYREVDAYPVSQLSREAVSARIQPLSSVLSDERQYQATAQECQALRQGQAIPAPATLNGNIERPVAVLDSTGELFAFAEFHQERNLLFPLQVFVR